MIIGLPLNISNETKIRQKTKHQNEIEMIVCVVYTLLSNSKTLDITSLDPKRLGFCHVYSLQMKALPSLYLAIFSQVRKEKEIQQYFLHYFSSQYLQNFFEGIRARCIFHA